MITHLGLLARLTSLVLCLFVSVIHVAVIWSLGGSIIYLVP